MTETLKGQLTQAANFIRDNIPYHPRLAITLGSGLSGFAHHLENCHRLKYSDIPYFTPTTVTGHEGFLVVGQFEKTSVLLLQGRTHYYEGHDLSQVVFPTRTLAHLGIRHLVLTNAAGGLHPKMQPGDFMIIEDHINLLGANPLRGPNPEFLGPRFPDMSDPYKLSLREILREALKKTKVRFFEGVYCGVPGPSYETAAEVKFLQMIGGHAVGMSTVAETIAACHAGLGVAGLSCITNKATGLASGLVTHDDVKENARKAEENFAAILKNFISLLSHHPAMMG